MGKEYRKSGKLASVTGVDLEELERLAGEEHPLDVVARTGARMLLEAAIEAEVEAALGRGRYERRIEDQQGYRNGVRSRTLSSGIGELEVEAPRVRGTDEPFRSGVLPAYTRILPKLTGILPALYTVSWKSFLQELVSRGLRMPKLIVCDGNPGLLRAVGETWPQAAIQRCVAHRIRNILEKVPKAYRESVKKSLHEIFHAEDETAARSMADEFVEKWGSQFASATKCLLDKLDACLTFYRFPSAHWKRIRTSNVLERTFKEARGRTNVVERFPTEQSALSLVWSVLVQQSTNWRGVEVKESQVIYIAEALRSMPKSMLAINNICWKEEELAA